MLGVILLVVAAVIFMPCMKGGAYVAIDSNQARGEDNATWLVGSAIALALYLLPFVLLFLAIASWVK